MQEEAEQPDPAEPDSVGQELCISCLHPNEPAVNFCAKCGAPLTFYSASAPFESVFAEGHVYRQCAESPRSFIVLLGVWIIFGLGALVGCAFLYMSRDGRVYDFLAGIIWVSVSVAMLWRTTRSYLARPRMNEDKAE